MPESFRIDRGTLGEGRIDHNDNLIVKGVLTRTGVFRYTHKDGTTTHELRHPDDVFNVDAVASFAQVPVTDEHPLGGRVTPDNMKEFTVGNLGDSLFREGPQQNLVAADLIIRDRQTIDQVLGKDGHPPKRFLSCGYKADVIEEAGEYMGERYDHRQTNIRGNHVAIVRTPRAGPVARLLLDDADAMLDEGDVSWTEVQGVIDTVIKDSLELISTNENLDDKQKSALSGKISKIAHEHPEWENNQVVAVAHKMLGLSKDSLDGHMRGYDDGYGSMSQGHQAQGHSKEVVIGKTAGGEDVHAAGEELEEHRKKKGKKENKKTETYGKDEKNYGKGLAGDSEEDVEDKGEGSRGGKIIGHTTSGKPIYANHNHKSHKGFSKQEHAEAYDHQFDRAHSTESMREHNKASDAVWHHAERAGFSKSSMASGMIPRFRKSSKKPTVEFQQKTRDSYLDDLDRVLDQGGAESPGSAITQTRGDIVKIKRDEIVIGYGDSELRMDALTIEVDDESEDSLELLLQRQDALVTFAEEMYADAEEARGERDAAMLRIDDPTKLDEAARERSDLLDVATFVGLKKDELRSVHNDEIKKLVVAQRHPDMVKEDSSREYIQGCFNMIVADAAQVSGNKEKLDELGKNANPHRSREDSEGAKPGDEGKILPSYRDRFLQDVEGVHTQSAEEIEEKLAS